MPDNTVDAPKVTKATKRGLETSELWYSVVGGGGIFAWATTSPNWQVQCAGLLATAWCIGKFIESRATIKKGL